MKQETMTLDDIAKMMQCHPRTVLRAVERVSNPYWTDDHNPSIKLTDLAEAYGCKALTFERVLKGQETIMTSKEAAEVLGIQPRTFRRKRPNRCLRSGGIVRFESTVINGMKFDKR